MLAAWRWSAATPFQAGTEYCGMAEYRHAANRRRAAVIKHETQMLATLPQPVRSAPSPQPATAVAAQGEIHRRRSTWRMAATRHSLEAAATPRSRWHTPPDMRARRTSADEAEVARQECQKWPVERMAGDAAICASV